MLVELLVVEPAWNAGAGTKDWGQPDMRIMKSERSLVVEYEILQ